MSALIRAAVSRLKAHRPFLPRILSHAIPPSSDPPPLPLIPHPLSQPRFPVRSLTVRDHSTTHQDCNRDPVSLGDEFELQGSLVDVDVTSGLVEQEVVGTVASEESLVDDGKDSVATAEINDPEIETWWADETGNNLENEPGRENEDEDATAEISDAESENGRAEETGNEQCSDLETENEHGEDDEDDDEEELGSSISEDDDIGFLQEICVDDEEFSSESAELELVSGEDVELLTLEEVKEVLQNVRARDVQIFPVHDRCEWTDLMVLATGISDRHVRGIADALVYKIKKKPHVDPRLYPIVEGHVGGKWLVVDCGNMVIHVLDEESRAYYKLEDLWTSDVKPGTADQPGVAMNVEGGHCISIVPLAQIKCTKEEGTGHFDSRIGDEVKIYGSRDNAIYFMLSMQELLLQQTAIALVYLKSEVIKQRASNDQ